MAGSRQPPSLKDQWRSGDTTRDRAKIRSEHPRERHRSPDPGFRERHREAKPGRKADREGPPSSSRRSRPRSRDRDTSRTRERRRTRDRSYSPTPEREVREDVYRPSRNRLPSEDRTSHKRRHRHDSPPLTKRRRSASPSPSRDYHKRSKRRRSRSLERSPSRAQVVPSSRIRADKTISSRTARSDRTAIRRSSPNSYLPSFSRPRSQSVDSRYGPTAPKGWKRLKSPDRPREESPVRSPSHRVTSRKRSPATENRSRRHQGHKESVSGRDINRSGREHKRSAQSPSPRLRRNSPSPPRRRRSPRPSQPERETESRRGAASQFSPFRRHSRSPARNKLSEEKTDIGVIGATRPHRSSKHSSKPNKFDYIEYDSDNRESASGEGKMRSSGRRPPRPHVDTQYSHPSPYMTPNQMSPQSQSPYGNSRGGWGGQHQYGSNQACVFHSPTSMRPLLTQHSSPVHGYSPNQSPYHQGYQAGGPPQNNYYQNSQYAPPPQQMQQGYQNQPYRGGQGGYRGNHFNGPDRRFSGPSPQTYSPTQSQRARAGGHFSNLSWTPATGNRGGRAPIDKTRSIVATPAGMTVTHTGEDEQPGLMEEEDNPFRPSKDLRVEDQTTQEENTMLPPGKAAQSGPQVQAGPKISFALKSKPPPAPAAMPTTDLSQRMKEPPSQPKAKSAIRPTSITLNNNKPKTDHRYDRRGDAPTDRRSNHRYPDSRSSRREETRSERRPEPRMEKRILKRIKPRPTLPPDLAASDSVYYRKPGNESVVGSGTYGKVFKAIHVYTKSMVALKKIRMEGERDGVSHRRIVMRLMLNSNSFPSPRSAK